MPGRSRCPAAPGQQHVLLGHPRLHLVNLQVREAGLDPAQDQRHRVIARVDRAHPQRRRRPGRPLRGRGGPVDVRENLPRIQQERAPGRGQPHVMGSALQQRNPEFAFQPLQLLAQRGLDDMLPGRRPPEVQLLGQGDEVTELAKLHADHPHPLRRYATAHPSTAPGRPRRKTSARRRKPALVITPADDRCLRWLFPSGHRKRCMRTWPPRRRGQMRGSDASTSRSGRRCPPGAMPARRHPPGTATCRRLPALPGPRGNLGPALPVPILRMGRVL